MKIEPSMLDFWKLPHYLQERVIGKYLEYPAGNKETEFVIERHEIGSSQHLDWRNSVDGYLVGWSQVGYSKDQPADVKVWLENKGKGFRAETKCYSTFCNEWMFDVWEQDGEYYYALAKDFHLLNIQELARQPKVWLFKNKKIGDRFEFKPGDVGAGVERPGHMTVLTRGKVKFSTQKPYFHEYYLKDDRYFKDWTRVIVRAVRGPKLGPGKEPGKFIERFWRFMIPIDQMPYALSTRALKKKWRPPKGIVPFPEEWAKKKFPKEYDRWIEYMKGHELEATLVDFTLSLHKYRGPVHKRGQFVLDWYLFLDDKGKGQVRTFNLKGDPIREQSIEAWYEGRDNRKYLEWGGRTRPLSRFNPNKKLYGELSILDQGKIEYESAREEGQETIKLKFSGKLLKGSWTLEQEEGGSEAYVFYQGNQLVELKEATSKFVYHRHFWNSKEHYDLRWKTGDTSKSEFAIQGDLLETETGQELMASFKRITEPKDQVEYWMIDQGTKVPRKVGSLETFVDVVDSGELSVLEENPQFISMILYGDKFKDQYVIAKRNSTWKISKSALPGKARLAKEGNPRTGKYYDPFVIEEKRGWDHFNVHIYDLRDFTRCEPGSKVPEYLPGKNIPGSVTVSVCLYPVPGTIHNARVAVVSFKKDDWTPDKAIGWIKENGLHTWESKQARKGQ